MSYNDGYRDGTVAVQKAIDTAHLIGRIQERKRILALIAAIKDNWEKPAVLNYPAELFKLMQLIEETK
jgi:hypothetical protein